MLDGAGSTRAMKARLLIDGASFGPDALKTVGQAFDDAWDEIAANFGLDPQAIDAARLRLANAVLSIADEDSRNVDVLKRAALLRMALDYPRARRRGGCSGIPARMSNVDKQRVAAVRTLEARLDAEFKVIVDARRHVGATQGGYRIEWTGVAIVWGAIAAVVAALALVLT